MAETELKGIPYSVEELEGASRQAPIYHRELMEWAAQQIRTEREQGRLDILREIVKVNPWRLERDEMGEDCIFCGNWRPVVDHVSYHHAPTCLYLRASQVPQ